MVRGYSRKTLTLRCALKIDLKKGFDSVNWSFVVKVLNFPMDFIRWIQICIIGSIFSIVVNGGLESYFWEGKGY